MITRPVRVAIVGPLLGENPGWVVSQGEVLEQHLRADGYDVRSTSRFPGRARRLADTVWSMLRWRHDVDVFVVLVFSGRGFAMAEAAVAAARFVQVPVVLHLHGGNLPQFASRHPRRVAHLLRSAGRVVAPSSYLQRELSRFGVDIVKIPNVVTLDDIDHVERTAARPRLLWMRTFDPEYNPRLAIEVAARLRPSHPDLELTMAGQDNGLLAEIRALAERESLTEHVHFPGFLDADAKHSALRTHDVFLNTNRVDNTPVSVIEAAASGLAIVATSVGGIPDLLENGKTALLVPDGDAAAMTDAVERLLSNPTLVTSLSREARAMAEQSQWPAVQPLWVKVLAEAMRA